LQIGSSKVSVTWAPNEEYKVYKYTLPSGLKAGAVIQLKFFASDGKTLKSSSAITVVKEPANSVANPKWLGESFTFGEWTMDLDAALKKAKENGSFTLALSTGALWCPFCKSFEETVLNADRFKKWAVENKVNLVALDNPKRSADDRKDASGVLTAVGSKANGAPPTLLRYAEDGNGVSGAAYLSRKMIAVGTASDKTTAEGVLQRNHDLLYKGGALCAPEEWRTSYPLFILVKPDGTAAGRILPAYDYSQAKWGVSLEETLARLNELLKLAASDETASKPSTTKSVLSVEESVNGSLQVNANRVFYKLSNIPTGKVAFSSSDKNLVLTVYETSSTLSAAKKVASGTGLVTVNFTSETNKYLEVSYFNDSLKAYGKNTTREFTITSAVTLLPKEELGTF
jgi:thiol-disulfide isomerase/thioredoxin